MLFPHAAMQELHEWVHEKRINPELKLMLKHNHCYCLRLKGATICSLSPPGDDGLIRCIRWNTTRGRLMDMDDLKEFLIEGGYCRA